MLISRELVCLLVRRSLLSLGPGAEGRSHSVTTLVVARLYGCPPEPGSIGLRAADEERTEFRGGSADLVRDHASKLRIRIIVNPQLFPLRQPQSRSSTFIVNQEKSTLRSRTRNLGCLPAVTPTGPPRQRLWRKRAREGGSLRAEHDAAQPSAGWHAPLPLLIALRRRDPRLLLLPPQPDPHHRDGHQRKR
eukprot:scaffold3342_cov135-Isochrysis_galbana.AAC.5